MKRKRYVDEQIAFALRQAEGGTSAERICRRMGVAEIHQLKQLDEENAKLKRLVADLTPDKTMLQDLLRRQW